MTTIKDIEAARFIVEKRGRTFGIRLPQKLLDILFEAYNEIRGIGPKPTNADVLIFFAARGWLDYQQSKSKIKTFVPPREDSRGKTQHAGTHATRKRK